MSRLSTGPWRSGPWPPGPTWTGSALHTLSAYSSPTPQGYLLGKIKNIVVSNDWCVLVDGMYIFNWEQVLSFKLERIITTSSTVLQYFTQGQYVKHG